MAEISDEWQDAQGETTWFINLLMLVPYLIDGVGIFIFLQGVLGTSSGGNTYGRYYG